MIRKKILELLDDFDTDVKEVVDKIIIFEHGALDKGNPRGMLDLIRKIIERKVRQNET